MTLSIVQSAGLKIGTSPAVLTATVTLPSAPATGAMLVAAVGLDKDAGTISAGSGWTVAASYNNTSVSQGVAYRVADGTATDQSCTFNWTTARGAQLVILETNLTSGALAQGSAFPNPATDTAATSITGDAGTAAADGAAVAFASMDSHGDATVSWSGGYSPLGEWRGDGVDEVAIANGGANVFAAARTLVSTNPTSTTFTASSSDQMALSVLRFTGTTSDTPVQGTLTSRWHGAVTTTDAVVVTKTANAEGVRLKVATDVGLAANATFTSIVAPDSDGMCKHAITGLTDDTTYYYGAEVDGVVDTVKTGTFTTFPSGQASFDFTFGSCSVSNTSGTWAAMQSRNPRFFIHLGDFHYANINVNDPAQFRAAFDAALANTAQASFYGAVPFAYVWSDHDFGPDSSHAGSPSAPAAQSVYRQYVPHYPLPDAAGIYQTFVVGRVRFVVTDHRSFRDVHTDTDDASKTMLGATQKQWFKDQITNATEPVIVWAQETPWIGSATLTNDTWAAYTTERTELANFIVASGKNVAILAGDMHALAADDGTNSPGGLALFHAAPFQGTSSNRGGPYTHGPVPTTGVSNTAQYGHMQVDDAGASISLAFTGYDAAGTQLLTYTKTFTVALAAPTGLTATPVSSSQIDLSWTPASGALTDVERDGVVIATDLAGSTYSDTGLDPSTSYDYRVGAVY